MKNYFTVPKVIEANPKRLANYCAVSIAEAFKECPLEKEIAAVERRLKQLSFEQVGLQLARKIAQVFQPMPTLKEISKVEAVVSKFYMTRLNIKPMSKAA